ncbi:MAG: hypothetical protein KDB82_03435 [Planctomycetes bacterium]|nr:hypothetical protein [Planctomycetota bacterium]
MSEYRSITVETGREFVGKYRKLDRRIERQGALRKAYIRAGDAEKAADAADRHSEALDEQEDLVFEEMRRLWVNARQTDETLPELPESWDTEASGRAIRFSFYEIEAFRGI